MISRLFQRFAWTGLLVVSVSAALWAQDSGKNVVLIGWDATQRDHLKEMIGRNEVPNLVALSKEGALVDMDVTAGATDTKAGWSQILTGYAPEKSGVYRNSKYQPIPVGYTIFERVEAQLGQDNVSTMAVIGKKGHVDCDPAQKIPYDEWFQKEKRAAEKKGKVLKDGAKPAEGEIIEENGAKFVCIPGKPYFNTKDHMDLFVNGLSENETVAAKAIENLEANKDKRFLLFVHFAMPDHAGHKSGENSQEYTDGVKSDDECTGKIIAKIKELGLYDNTLIYVTADHGFDEGKKGHAYAPYVFLATNDPTVKRNGNRMDVAPTILKRFGVDLSKIQPALDGIPMDEPAPDRLAPAENPNAPQKPQKAKKAGKARKAKGAADGQG